ncbi:tetratricopeptide repeat protein [Streptomyces sp. DSM 3412]|uniref:Tetratricopeptide repeat protein n=1 Tax=Streptomyces gottesmaniae TaxID=3075518 RepID=A0ABU2Z0K6_9ACTN|nr:tetratricopeptide repeat protein [Streptomyces sp. DSM 3412]MDT0570112.1 tetratricopeptide repeat protein [Streptomyces sp. DSM 3412]
MEEALKNLKQRLRAAHLEAGEVSMREISKRCHGAVSHTTAHQVIRGDGLPSWRSLEPVVAALGESVEDFKRLWLQARRGTEIDSAGTPTWDAAFRPRMDPETTGILNLAGAYASQNKHDEAKSMLLSYVDSGKSIDATAAIYLYSNYSYRYADVKEKYGEYVESFVKHGEVLDIEYSPTAHWLAERAYDSLNHARAIEFVQRAIQINPTQPWHWRLHGRILTSMGRYKEAEEVLFAAHETSLESDFWYSDLAKLLKLTRQFHKLEKFLRAEYESATGDSLCDLFENYIECLLMCGKKDEALSVARDAVARETDEEFYASAALISLSRVLCFQGKFEEARGAIKSSPLYPRIKTLESEYGNTLLREGLIEKGIEVLKGIYEEDSA